MYTNTDATLDAGPVDDCSCGGTLGLRYERGHAFVECDSCDVTRIASVPPVLVAAHDAEANPELLGQFTTTQLQQTVRGFCHLCDGPVEGTVVDPSRDGEVDASGGVRVAYECTECGAPFYTAASTAVLDHPAVVSLLHDAGIDYREVPSWAITRTLDPEERVRDADPLRVEVTVHVEGDRIAFVLDANLDVIEYTRP